VNADAVTAVKGCALGEGPAAQLPRPSGEHVLVAVATVREPDDKAMAQAGVTPKLPCRLAVVLHLGCTVMVFTGAFEVKTQAGATPTPRGVLGLFVNCGTETLQMGCTERPSTVLEAKPHAGVTLRAPSTGAEMLQTGCTVMEPGVPEVKGHAGTTNSPLVGEGWAFGV